jgi:hypothetical protein
MIGHTAWIPWACVRIHAGVIVCPMCKAGVALDFFFSYLLTQAHNHKGAVEYAKRRVLLPLKTVGPFKYYNR